MNQQQHPTVTTSPALTLLLSVICSLLVPCLFSFSSPELAARPVEIQHLNDPEAVPKGVSASDWKDIRAAYQANRHAASGDCMTPPDGMVSWWPGDGKTGDIVGGHNGGLQGTATFGLCMVDQAFRLDGVSSKNFFCWVTAN